MYSSRNLNIFFFQNSSVKDMKSASQTALPIGQFWLDWLYCRSLLEESISLQLEFWKKSCVFLSIFTNLCRWNKFFNFVKNSFKALCTHMWLMGCPNLYKLQDSWSSLFWKFSPIQRQNEYLNFFSLISFRFTYQLSNMVDTSIWAVSAALLL